MSLADFDRAIRGEPGGNLMLGNQSAALPPLVEMGMGAGDFSGLGMSGNAGQAGTIGGMGLGGAMGAGWGSTLGGLGSLAGLATGALGLGALGNAIGTGIDYGSYQGALGTSAANNPGLGIGSLGFTDYLSGLLNNASFGMLGTPLGDAAVAAAIAGTPMSGLPGNPLGDPESYANAQAATGQYSDALAGYGMGAFGDSAGAGVGADGSTSEAGSSSSSVGDGGASAGGFY